MNFYQDIVRFRISQDWLLGVLVGIPFAYPAEPFYWVAILAFLFALPRFRLDRRGLYLLALIVAMWVLILVATFTMPDEYDLNLPSVFGSFVTFGLFMFAYGIKDIERFLNGFLAVITIYVILTFIMFVVLKSYSHGVNLFVDSGLRMWGDGYLPEWPNVFCGFLCIGFFIYWMRGDLMMAYITLAAAILTTSRIALVALGCSILFDLLNRQRVSYWLILLIMVSIAACALLLIGLPADYVEHRLLKIGDRMIILKDSWVVFSSNPFGIGNVSFGNISESYASYHSSFVKILVRYGIIGLLIFILIIKPRYLCRDITSRVNAAILFMIIIGLFQDMLLHMHFILIYTVLLAYREQKSASVMVVAK